MIIWLYLESWTNSENFHWSLSLLASPPCRIFVLFVVYDLPVGSHIYFQHSPCGRSVKCSRTSRNSKRSRKGNLSSCMVPSIGRRQRVLLQSIQHTFDTKESRGSLSTVTHLNRIEYLNKRINIYSRWQGQWCMRNICQNHTRLKRRAQLSIWWIVVQHPKCTILTPTRSFMKRSQTYPMLGYSALLHLYTFPTKSGKSLIPSRRNVSS